MEIVQSPDGSSLKVIKSLEEEIESTQDQELKEKLQKFLDDFNDIKKKEESFRKLLNPKLEDMGKRMNEFNKKK